MTGYVWKLSYDQDRVSTTGRLGQVGTEALTSSSRSLGTERGLRALHPAVEPAHVLESDALELLCTFSLTLGTSSLPSSAGGRRARSRLGGEREMEPGEGGVREGVEILKELRESDRCWNDWENLAIILSDEQCSEGGAG